MYMIDNSKSLNLIGGITAILSGLLIVFISIWFLFQSNNRPDVLHGFSVVMLILMVPTVIATTALLIKDVKTGALLGIGFASLWILVELIAHCSQTAPLKTINVLFTGTETENAETAVKWVWMEWGNALMMIGAFSYSVAAICYGFSLRKWGNPASGYLLILSAIVFILTFIPQVNLYWHVLFRGIAILFLGGVLLSAPGPTAYEEWET